MKITARDTANWRKTDEKVTELARDYLTNVAFVTDDPLIMKSAFMMILPFIEITEAASQRVGALIGYFSDTVKGMGANGYPIFTSIGFLHRDDVARFNDEVDRMREALGVKK